jgi:hypothetical protein
MSRRQPPPLFGANWAALGTVPRRNIAVRFAFGAVVSVLAGLVGYGFGPTAGGLLLAFPAILPATLTLIEKEEGDRPARADDDGAALGAVALVAFAAAGWLLLPDYGAAVALLAATGSWLAVAVGLYLLSRLLGRWPSAPPPG